MKTPYTLSVLDFDVYGEISRICNFILKKVTKDFRRKGAVVGLSGGVDSAVVAELCVRAIGKNRVLGLVLPEKESNPVSAEYAYKEAEKLGIRVIKIDITGHLQSLGLYKIRDTVIKGIFPDFSSSHRFHITLPQNLLENSRVNYHFITIEGENGDRITKRLDIKDWLEISACQNMKQRIRAVQLYYHADKENLVVAGTTNKPELIQGFFVKYGDGGVDIEPISHLYKTQVYRLAREIGVVQEIINRPPSPDTYSLPVTDKEFYFCMEYELLDLLLYAYENKVPWEDVSKETGLEKEQIERAFRDFEAKGRATWHLRQMPPSLIRL